MVSETVEAEGHLIDSGNFQSILTTIVEHGSEYEILRFDIGRRNEEGSHLTLKLTSDTDDRLQDLLSKLSVFGCYVKGTPNAVLRAADMDGAAPEDFYSTTNHRTAVFLDDEWVTADDQRMDAVLVVDKGRVSCRKLRDVRKSDLIVCGMQGIRVAPDVQSRDKPSVRLHEQRGVVGAPRRNRGGERRRPDAPRQGARAARSRSLPARWWCTPAAHSISAS